MESEKRCKLSFWVSSLPVYSYLFPTPLLDILIYFVLKLVLNS